MQFYKLLKTNNTVRKRNLSLMIAVDNVDVTNCKYYFYPVKSGQMDRHTTQPVTSKKRHLLCGPEETPGDFGFQQEEST